MLLLPLPAHSGAWARGEGETFFSYAKTTVPETGEESRALYLEHGWSARLTLGVKIDRVTPVDGLSVAFLRRHLSDADARTQVALEFGVGRLETDGNGDAAASAAAIAGRGFETRLGNAWAEVELRHTEAGTWWQNLDVTLGLALDDRNSVMVQSQSYRDDDESRTILAPSYLRTFGPHLTTKVGVTIGADRPVGVEAGAWLAF